MCQGMRYSLVQFAIIFLFLQCVQGEIRRFNTERLPEDIEYVVKDLRNSFSRSDINVDGDVNGLPQLRTRRQNMGGDPVASSVYLFNDNRRYARLSYIGEGSKVNTLP